MNDKLIKDSKMHKCSHKYTIKAFKIFQKLLEVCGHILFPNLQKYFNLCHNTS